ncbi:phytanoyl-CoA dioxygenase [Paenibacillus swuensis]|uniref:Phytanoyl-CoA dioxygenase n=1 Tax=Paenibacillus swuensis TaxID=1178515 RepID=A0A172TNE7_9BACL|nr:phytanoyl-CoA dioxygenase family protein [Paenibacillus swuensis]ANE48347.1 phytanoyl-CoA dioxygenase [Paenibacillus swuensis]
MLHSIETQTETAIRKDRYSVSVEQYKQYHRDGYLKVEGLLSQADVTKLHDWAVELHKAGEHERRMAEEASKDPLKEEFAQQTRVHMLSRQHATGEWALLHPRVLDVLEALIGPDVYALQSMLFHNPPGRGGQGWHQDSYYIRTQPDSLIGAWMALEEADEDNGCLWVVPGSNHEPIYPTDPAAHSHSEGPLGDLPTVANVSHIDDEVNTLSKIVAHYPPAISVPMKPGDILFFHSHLFHRSYPNKTADRYRRSYVCHYCNGRSWVPWDHDGPYEGDSGNHLHILARGRTHLPFAAPKFGTEVQLSNESESADNLPMMPNDKGMMMPGASVSMMMGDPTKDGKMM